MVRPVRFLVTVEEIRADTDATERTKPVKLHDLQPAAGSRKARTRVGRGIAAGKGKTAGRGTKGQKARAGGSIPAWFEGGQTPIHIRVPKLRGFRNRVQDRIPGRQRRRASPRTPRPALRLEGRGQAVGQGERAVTVNQEILRAVGLVRTPRTSRSRSSATASCRRRCSSSPTRSRRRARAKIEAAGGSVKVLEVRRDAAAPRLGVDVRSRSAEAPSRAATAGRGCEAEPEAAEAEPSPPRPKADKPAKADRAEPPTEAPAGRRARKTEPPDIDGDRRGTASRRTPTRHSRPTTDDDRRRCEPAAGRRGRRSRTGDEA